MRKQSLLLRALSFTALSFLALPVIALISRIDFANFLSAITSPAATQAFQVSLKTSIIAAIACAAFGVPLAWLLNQSRNTASRYVRAVVLSPLVLPPTVAGIALLSLLGRNGLLGQWIFEVTASSVAFTQLAVIIAGIFVGLPFTVLLSEAAFANVSKEQLMAAETDGATPAQLFFKVALPQTKGSIGNAVLMAWARAFGEFGATLMFAGSIPALTRTLPMQVYSSLETDPQIAYSISALMVLIAVAVTIAMRKQLAQALHN